MRADVIISRGRTGQVSGMSLASVGRLANIGEIIITVIRTEIIRLTSSITRIVELNSRL